MAVLDAENRRRVGNTWMRENAEPIAVAKPVVRSAIDAIDQWIEDNQASFLAALPVAFRTGTTATQKTMAFCLVAQRRAGRLRAEED